MPSSNPDFPTQRGSGLSLNQLARARSYSYRLFSQLFLQGITAVSLPTIQQIPELTAVLPQPFNADAFAAGHHDLFQFNVFAYESFFLSADGLVGGEKTAVVNQHYFKLGCESINSQADHLGHELACLAYLTSQEADAGEAGLPRLADELRKKQQQFMQAHLLIWAPACLLAVQNQSNPFFAELARLTQLLLLEHFEDLGETAVSLPRSFLPPIQNILADAKTGFKEITHFLLLPAFSGIYLSRENIGQLGRQFALPRGFGSRETMLLNLLRTAVQYDSLNQMLTALGKTCQIWQKSYQQISTTHPRVAPLIHPWHERSQATSTLLKEMMASSSIVS